ncbi:MAG: MerR family transcriptional regulator [bacterium]
MIFNSKTACKLTGVTQRQIDYWDKTHLIKPSVKEASGYGSVRLYSFVDLVQLKVLKTLIDQGISLQKVRKSISYLKKNFPEIRKPLAELRFITDSKTIFILTRNKKVILDTLAKGQLVMSIAIGEIIEGLKGAVENIREERKYKVKAKKKYYEVLLHPDLEDGGYWVECPALSGCDSQGDTVEEALELIKDAIEGHLEIVEENKKARKASA